MPRSPAIVDPRQGSKPMNPSTSTSSRFPQVKSDPDPDSQSESDSEDVSQDEFTSDHDGDSQYSQQTSDSQSDFSTGSTDSDSEVPTQSQNEPSDAKVDVLNTIEEDVYREMLLRKTFAEVAGNLGCRGDEALGGNIICQFLFCFF